MLGPPSSRMMVGMRPASRSLLRFATPKVVMTASAPPSTAASITAPGSSSPSMAPWVRAWSIATIKALPSEATNGTFLTFTPEVICREECKLSASQHFGQSALDCSREGDSTILEGTFSRLAQVCYEKSYNDAGHAAVFRAL